MIATATIAAIGNGAAFKKGRGFAAWLGVVPGEHSTGGKQTADWYQQTRKQISAQALRAGCAYRPAAENETIYRPEYVAGSVSPPASAFRWRPWRWPTRWRAWSGRCCPKEKPIARRYYHKLVAA